MIFIFTGSAGRPHGYRDRWLDDDTLEYWGEGQEGDMTFVRGNRAVRNHVLDSKDLFLFASTQQSGVYQFIDQMVCTGYRMDRGADGTGNQRDEIVFQLLRMGAIASTGDELHDVTALEKDLEVLSLDELRQRALDTSASSLPPVERKGIYRRKSAAIKEYAKRRANGHCEGCHAKAPFMTKQDEPYLEVHHIRRLTDNGPDHPDSVVALCPTCPRRAHYASDGSTYNEKLGSVAAALAETASD